MSNKTDDKGKKKNKKKARERLFNDAKMSFAPKVNNWQVTYTTTTEIEKVELLPQK